jgi:hypothetical protein
MKRNRSRISTIALPAALAVLALLPVSALAGGSLLGGYGGPGEGNQAILGSALVNGPRGGSGGGGAGSSGGSAVSPGASGTAGAETTSIALQVGGKGWGRGGARHPTASRSGRTTGGSAQAASPGAGQASKSPFDAYPASESRQAAQLTSGGAGMLGLSGEDLLYILLALVLLALTGVLTMRLTRVAASEGRR